MSTASIVIGSLQSPALYVSGFTAEVFSDSARTVKVASMACGAKQIYPNYGSTTVAQASVTPNITDQAVQVASLSIGGHTIAAGSLLLVGAGASAEIVMVVSASTSGGNSFVDAVFTKAHVSGDAVYLLISSEPNATWTQSSIMVANGLAPSTTYYISVGATSPGGAVNWTNYSLTTAAAGTTFAGTFSQAVGGVTTYTLTATSPPGDLLHYEAFFAVDGVVPVSGSTPTWVGSGTSLSVVTSSNSTGTIGTLFVRAVGTSGNYRWVVVDQITIKATLTTGSVRTNLGSTLDALVPFVSGLDNTFPPPDTIYNPSFEYGNVGWNLGTNWGIGEGHPCFGEWSAYVAGTVGSPLISSDSITNNYQLPVTVGASYFAQVMIDASAASGGYGEVFLAFYNASNTLLSTANGNQVQSGGLGWNLSYVQAVAPSGASYAKVGCTVAGQSTGTVYVDDFEANALPPGPVDVPDGPVYVKLANVGPDHNIHVSTALNPQGSILPNQEIPVTYSYTASTITLTCASLTLLRADGTTFTIPGGTKTYTGLSIDVTYYVYPYIQISDGTLQFSNPDPPGTSPSSTQALQASGDGRIGLGVVVVTTLPAGDTVTDIGYSFNPTLGYGPPSVSISITGDGEGASAYVSWAVGGGSGPDTEWVATLHITGGLHYSTATALITITVASGGDAGYSNGTISTTCGLTTATGSSGGGTTCPEADELVDVLGKGIIRVGDVQAGDSILGWSFEENRKVYRRVILSTQVVCSSWRIVDGYKCSPTEAIYYNGSWIPAYRAPSATVDKSRGYKVKLSVESDEYSEQNFYLVKGSEPLLIHNQRVSSC